MMTKEEWKKEVQRWRKENKKEERKQFLIQAQESCWTCARRGKERIKEDNGWRFSCEAWGLLSIHYSEKTEKHELQSGSCRLWKSMEKTLFDEPETEDDLKYKILHYHDESIESQMAAWGEAPSVLQN